MTRWKSKIPGKKRRTCYDRLRAQMIAARRGRRSDPAASAAAQLAALFLVVFGRMPPLMPPSPFPYVAPPLSPGQARRNEIARRLGVPSRYVDVVLSQGVIPYALLFDHVRRGGAARRDAMKELRKRVPEATVDWLDYVERWGLWSNLIRCFVHNGVDEDTNIKVLKSTLAWLGDVRSDSGTPGPADAGEVLAPAAGGNGHDPEDDPLKPKP